MKKMCTIAVALTLAPVAAANPPLPDGPDGKPVKPTVSYSYSWFATDGTPLMMRVPVHGKRRFTPRSGGVL